MTTFFGASNFNQDVLEWDVSQVYLVDEMFGGAVGFNQDISTWDVNEVNSMGAMFEMEPTTFTKTSVLGEVD